MLVKVIKCDCLDCIDKRNNNPKSDIRNITINCLLDRTYQVKSVFLSDGIANKKFYEVINGDINYLHVDSCIDITEFRNSQIDKIC